LGRQIAYNSVRNEYLIVWEDANAGIAGQRVSSNGTASSIFGYSGEQVDTSGLVFLRARYMQPRLGIFLARDSWSGDVMRPGSMNGWNYASANPVNRVDPSGKTDVWDVLAMLYDGLLKNPCIQWEPFGPPLGRNAGFAYVKPGFLGWSQPNQEWDPSQRNIVERDFTSAIYRFSGKKSDGSENPRGNPAFGSMPMTLAQLKVSPTYPMILFRQHAGDDGNEIAAAIVPYDWKRRHFTIYDLFFQESQNDAEPKQERVYLAPLSRPQIGQTKV
jgi:RHS repeat-associated protein